MRWREVTSTAEGFAFEAERADDICFLICYFQNQRDQSCIGRVALRPARGFFRQRESIDLITFEIDCVPAAFGSARIAVPLPKHVQGTRQSFEVGASAHYPDGKGRKLRFADGLLVRSNTEFGNAFGTALTVAGAMTGQIVLTSPAKVTIDLPSSVADELPDNMQPSINTLWKLGDPPLDLASAS